MPKKETFGATANFSSLRRTSSIPTARRYGDCLGRGTLATASQMKPEHTIFFWPFASLKFVFAVFNQLLQISEELIDLKDESEVKMSDLGFILEKQAERNRSAKKNKPIVSKRQIAATGVSSLMPGSQILTACNLKDTADIIEFGLVLRSLTVCHRIRTANCYFYGNGSKGYMKFERINGQLAITMTGRFYGSLFVLGKTVCNNSECEFQKILNEGKDFLEIIG